MSEAGVSNSCVYYANEGGGYTVFVKKTKKSYIIDNTQFEFLLRFFQQEEDVGPYSSEELALLNQATAPGILPNSSPEEMPTGYRLYECDRFLENKLATKIIRFAVTFLGIPFLALSLARAWILALISDRVYVLGDTWNSLSAFVLCFLIGISIFSSIHELCHALIARYHGAHIPEISVQASNGRAPFRTYVIGMARKSLGAKIEYYAGGINAHCLLAGISLLLWLISLQTAFLSFFCVNIFLGSVNTMAVSPLTDGYKIANCISVKTKSKVSSTRRCLHMRIAVSCCSIVLFVLGVGYVFSSVRF